MSLLNLLQYRIGDMRIPHNALSIRMQENFCPPLYQTYLSQAPGKFSRIMLTNCTLVVIIILSLSNAIYFCKNAFGMSSVMTSLFIFTSITPVFIIAFDTLVEIVTSLCKTYAYCVLSFSYILVFMVLSLFSFKKIILSIDFFFHTLSFC